QIWRALGQAHGYLAEELESLGDLPKAAEERRRAGEAFSEAVRVDPNNPVACNNLAWYLATCPEREQRDPKRALALARRALQLKPADHAAQNTLGVAQYRNGDWEGSIESLTKATSLWKGGHPCDWVFLAMAHWRLDNKEEARRCYDKALKAYESHWDG